jgi:acyl-coenzyme A synthetase/AMP-(fatty) acid ligase
VPDDIAGEIPKAYVVKSSAAGSNDAVTSQSITMHVQDHKTRYKWLMGGVQFIDAIPKSPSGKILRRFLRDKDRAWRRRSNAAL